jgi:hypothetical protein
MSDTRFPVSCDHHFSICYGRPPLTRDFSSITPPTHFLRSDFAIEDDARLVSQVEIWTISTKVFDQFGLNPEGHISSHMVPAFRRLLIGLDTWRADWVDRFLINSNVGNYPKKGVGLHYHFARLFLCSHSYRNASSEGENPGRLDPDLEELAMNAISSAMSILQVVVADVEIQDYLNGLPAYFVSCIPAWCIQFVRPYKVPRLLPRVHSLLCAMDSDDANMLVKGHDDRLQLRLPPQNCGEEPIESAHR